MAGDLLDFGSGNARCTCAPACRAATTPAAWHACAMADILKSMWHLLVTTPALQRRAFYQGIIFASFNLFWTGIPLLLTEIFGYSQRQIALFALAGAAGALAAPVAGRLADRGYTRRALPPP